MSKIKNKAVVAPIVEAPAQASVETIEVTLPKGRPVDPESARQKRLATQTPGKGRGRNVDPGSARQAKLQAMKAKAVAGMEIKRGRPADPTSARAIKLAERENKLNELRKAKLAEIEAAKKQELVKA